MWFARLYWSSFKLSSDNPPVEVVLLCVCGRERLSLAERSDGAEGKGDSGDLFLYSPLKVVIFVALMCGMLVLMYFFYNVLGECHWQQDHGQWAVTVSTGSMTFIFCSVQTVYVIIAIFCLASASALFSCFDAVLEKLGCGTVRCVSSFWKCSCLALQ